MPTTVTHAADNVKCSEAAVIILTPLGNPLLLLLLALILAPAVGAQTIRGTVEDSTGMPLNDVRVSLIAAASDSTVRETRTGNAGDFSLNAGRSGKYRVRLNRIGFAQQTSSIIDLQATQIVTLRFKMVVVAQQLAEVVVVERRNVTLSELMSTSGFDLRQAKYPMRTLNAEQLLEEGRSDLEFMIANGRMLGVEVFDDTVGRTFKMWRFGGLSGRMRCDPEIYLDARRLSPESPMAPYMAFERISRITADVLYGVEVYPENQLPPPSLGGDLGTIPDRSSRLLKSCGVVAVWTKAGREALLLRERARADGSRQVLRGRVIDFTTGKPIPGAVLTLKSELLANLEAPVIADSTGTFAITTRQFERLRLGASAGGYVELATPAFNVELEELLTVEVILSTRHQPVAPIALVSRELARMYAATNIKGFSFRRRRGLAGTFFDATQIARSNARTLTELVRGTPHVTIAGGPDVPGIVFETATVIPNKRSQAPVTTASCKPMYFLNGELQRDPESTVLALQQSLVFGVELFPIASEVPFIYRMGSTGCGVIVVWTKDWVK